MRSAPQQSAGAVLVVELEVVEVEVLELLVELLLVEVLGTVVLEVDEVVLGSGSEVVDDVLVLVVDGVGPVLVVVGSRLVLVVDDVLVVLGSSVLVVEARVVVVVLAPGQKLVSMRVHSSTHSRKAPAAELPGQVAPPK